MVLGNNEDIYQAFKQMFLEKCELMTKLHANVALTHGLSCRLKLLLAGSIVASDQ